MTFQTEFPDFPIADMPAIPAGFADTSWRNDTCPSFTCAEHGFRLCVEHADKALREYEGAARFTLYPLNEDGECGAELIETESWNEMNSALIDYTT